MSISIMATVCKQIVAYQYFYGTGKITSVTGRWLLFTFNARKQFHCELCNCLYNAADGQKLMQQMQNFHSWTSSFLQGKN